MSRPRFLADHDLNEHIVVVLVPKNLMWGLTRYPN